MWEFILVEGVPLEHPVKEQEFIIYRKAIGHNVTLVRDEFDKKYE